MAINTDIRSRGAGAPAQNPSDLRLTSGGATVPARPMSDKEAPRYTKINNIAIRAEGYIRRKDSIIGLRGTDYLTGEQRSVALMSPDRAAEIMSNGHETFESRVSKFLSKFARRPEIENITLGSVVAFSDVFQVPGEQMLAARWPSLMKEHGRPFEALTYGLVSASYRRPPEGSAPGAQRRFTINVFDDRSALELDPRQTPAISELFSPVDQDGKLKQIQMLVAARAPNGEAQGYVLGQSARWEQGGAEASDGRWVDTTKELVRELYQMDPSTYVATLDKSRWAEAAMRVMQNMVFGQHLGRSAGYAAGIIAAALSKKGLEDAFQQLKFHDDVPQEDRDGVFALMQTVREGGLDLAIMPGALYRPFDSVNKRLNQDLDSAHAGQREPRLGGGGYFEGYVGLKSFLIANAAKPGDKDTHLDSGRVQALVEYDTTSRGPKMKLGQVAQMVFEGLDAQTAHYASDRGMTR